MSNQVIGILKGNWSLRRRQRLPLHFMTHPSPSLRATLRLWYNLHSFFYFFCQRGESSKKGSNDSVFGDLCQRGREREPKAKGPHHHPPPISKNLVFQLVLKNDFQLVNFKLVSYYVQKGEKVVFSKLIF
jgi:hypothetical protein